jgi:EAL domain-containing protein (putative c-di-GMP-specific phosphodiesterase class I)
MGHGLNMSLLAEGVETGEQLHFLKNHNCDAIQGYVLSPPLPIDEIEAFMARENSGNGKGKKLIDEAEARK